MPIFLAQISFMITKSWLVYKIGGSVKKLVSVTRWVELLLFLTRGSGTLSLVFSELSRFSDWKKSINRNLRVNFCILLFSSMVCTRIFFRREGFFRLQDIWDILEGYVRINDLVLWILIWVLLPNFFISVSKSIIFHLQRRNYNSPKTGEKTKWYIRAR